VDKFSRSWDMIAQSFSVLRKDKKLVVFPILSGLSALAIAAAYFIPMSRVGILHPPARGEHLDPTVYAWFFLWYCTNYFVIILFNCALAACAQIRFSGGEPTLADGMAKAAAKFPNILLWAIVSATVGTILRIIEDRAESFGKIVSELLGVAWAAVTYLIVPVLVFEEESVFSSIKRSGQLLRKTWGEEIAGSFGFGLPFLVLSIPGILIAFAGMRFRPLWFAAAVLYFLMLAAAMSAVKGIFAVALYRYATQGEAPAGFSQVMLNGAFVDVSNRD
jgi:uncharacterized membrane protein YeaQ/YmgE (transglycosylase-associated protein family)